MRILPPVALIALIAGCRASSSPAPGTSGAAGRAPSVDVVCDQVDNPGMGSTDFTMSFTVTNHERVAVTALVFEIADTNLKGQPTGEASTYTLTGPFSPGPAIEIMKGDVPEPPHYRPDKF